MNEEVAAFEAVRPKLFGIAYRMLGTVADAEDVLQDAYLRFAASKPVDVRSTEAWLVTIVTRLCLDRIKSAQAQREVYVGPWLPEPLMTDLPPEAKDPAEHMADLESISFAFVLLLQSLTPEERAVFLLRQVFDYGYEEIASFIGKSEATCRQLSSRAKKHIADHRPRIKTTPAEHQRVLAGFMQAVSTGDIAGLMQLMSSNVTLTADGGGKALAATHPIHGPDHVARYILGLAKKTQGLRFEVTPVNGQSGIHIYLAGQLVTTIALDIAAERIQAVYFIVNPDKLSRVQ